MKPTKTWMEVKLWKGQSSEVEVQIALPDSVDQTRDDAAVFEILSMGAGASDVTTARVGDVVMLEGALAVSRVKKPNKEEALVAKAEDVAFIIEESDLRRGSR